MNSNLEEPFRITISMRGTRPLYVNENLSAFLEAFERSTFAPDRWSATERGALPYSRQEILELASRGKGRPLRQAYAFIRRTKNPRFECRFDLSDRTGFRMEPNPKLTKAHWEGLFRFADELASICQPHWGGCHIWYLARPLDRRDGPFNQDELDAEIMMSGALLAPVDYYDHGPEGLVMRTYIGPHFLRQLGEERVRTLPLELDSPPWGGFRVDVLPRPWTANLGELLGPWRKGMAHLRPAEVLALPRIEGERLRGFFRAPRCIIEASHE